MGTNTPTEKKSTKSAFLFISGSNLDKRHQGLLNQIINRDKDIQKLIRKAYSAKPRLSMLIIIVSLLFYFIPAAYSGIDSIKKIIEDSSGKYILYAVLILCVLNSIQSFVDRIIRVIREMKSFRTYIQVRFTKRLLPKRPLDLWHLYPANITDGQIALYVQRLLDRVNPQEDTTCRLIYAGEPYMSHYLVDSIDIDWSFKKSVGIFKRHMIRHHYRKFYKQFAIQSVYASATDKMNNVYDQNNSIRQTSNYVFGIMFASRYFKCFLEKYHKGHEKVLIEISDGNNQQLVENVLQHLTSPNNFTFLAKKSDDRASDLVLEVKKISIPFPIPQKDNIKWYIKLISFIKRLGSSFYNNLTARNAIHIPIKRLFLTSSNENGKPLLLNDLEEVNEDTIVLLGGAEQSLSQCYLINRYRWKLDSSSKFRIGFAENEFDSSDSENYEFYVGTEGFVYGRYMNKIIAPDASPNKSKRNYAEKLQFSLDNKSIVILYGYHAISTKIAAAQYFLDQVSPNKEHSIAACERFLKQNKLICPLLTYRYMVNNKDDWDTLKHHWDLHNTLDNAALIPEEALATIDTEFQAIVVSAEL